MRATSSATSEPGRRRTRGLGPDESRSGFRQAGHGDAISCGDPLSSRRGEAAEHPEHLQQLHTLAEGPLDVHTAPIV